MTMIKTKNILLIGVDGQVGWELQRCLQPLGRVTCCGRQEKEGRTVLDLADIASIHETIRQLKPDVIVNAAAYTAVDKAESEIELAQAINGHAPGALAQAAANCGAILLHYSVWKLLR